MTRITIEGELSRQDGADTLFVDGMPLHNILLAVFDSLHDGRGTVHFGRMRVDLDCQERAAA